MSDYADSLRQQAKWIREALTDGADALVNGFDLGDVDTDELESAATEIDRLLATNQALEAKIAGMSEALKPFARKCELAEPSFDSTRRPDTFTVNVSLGDLRRAKAAYRSTR